MNALRTLKTMYANQYNETLKQASPTKGRKFGLAIYANGQLMQTMHTTTKRRFGNLIKSMVRNGI